LAEVVGWNGRANGHRVLRVFTHNLGVISLRFIRPSKLLLQTRPVWDHGMVPFRRRTGLTAAAGELLGTPVQVAVPLQRHPPQRVVGLCLAELATLAGFMITGQDALFALLAVLAAALLVLAATNRHRVLAVNASGAVVLAATARWRPCGVIGPAPEGLSVPNPAGLGVAVMLADGRWWVDRSAFVRAQRARVLLEPDS
jgi:hypothetical protein